MKRILILIQHLLLFLIHNSHHQYQTFPITCQWPKWPLPLKPYIMCAWFTHTILYQKNLQIRNEIHVCAYKVKGLFCVFIQFFSLCNYNLIILITMKFFIKFVSPHKEINSQIHISQQNSASNTTGNFQCWN